MKSKFQEYFKQIRNKYLTGDYTEVTLRTPFENFIKSLNNDFNLIHEPKREQKLGAPDFKAYRKAVKVGYIETKDLGKNLDDELGSEQVKKYKESINNVILTNYNRFILIKNNQKIFDFSLFSLSDLNNSKFVISDDKIEEFSKLIETFFDYKLEVKSPKELAEQLSRKAKLLKDSAKEQLEEDLSKVKNNEEPSSVHDFYVGLKELIKDINIDDCADAYAQTIAYGLFLARINCPDKLDRNTASSYIPPNISVIKRIFINISGYSLPPNVSWIVDDMIDILNASDIKNILSEIDFRGKTDRDPFTFFYEDFLTLYDPEKKKHLGVYYTPRPVVNFIVKSIEHILKKDFGKLSGFSEDDVNVLDPAAGTGTFLWLVYLRAIVELKNKGLGGLIKKKIENHILKDFYGFELLVTPYIIAHLKLAMVLKKWFYELKPNDRIQVFLTNTLEPSEIHGLLPFLKEIGRESKMANELKLKTPILVILGNPPYAGTSANKGKWISDLLKKGYTRADGSKDDGYYKVDGNPLREKNPKWLQDDYVKFIRFSQWKIDTAGKGVIGFITNHSYLDNPTFRGMRQSLLDSFDRIYILNLHGSTLKKERCPDGSKDENVFDIRPGVAIVLFVRNKKFKDKKVFYADLYGKREYKYYWLDRNDIDTVKWQKLNPKTPYYFFIPRESSLQSEYEKYWKITDIFPINSVAIVTARDGLTIKCTSEEVWNTVSNFAKMDPEVARKMYNLGKDARDWKVKLAQKDLIDSGLKKEKIVPILYRPFDIRYTYYTGKSRGFHCMPRPSIMYHMKQENLGLVTCRQLSSKVWRHILISNKITDDCFVSNKTKERGYLLPLYLYSDIGRKSNINPKLVKHLSETYKKEPNPEEIFYYVYAVLHSDAYRTKYAEFLKIDFPHIPFTKDYKIFKELSELGEELVELHLMKKKLKSKIRFNVSGSNIVELVKNKDGKIYVNKEQYFDGIPKEAWDFYIGSYQVLDKWLKSRKNRELTGEEIEQFIQIVEIINQTIEYMKKIDKIKLFD